jgi:hypothetical protein
MGQGPTLGKKCKTLSKEKMKTKKATGVTPVLEYLLSKHEVLTSTLGTIKKKIRCKKTIVDIHTYLLSRILSG